MANILQDQLGYSDMKNHPLQPAIENMQMSNQQLAQMLSMLLDKLNQPKTVIRGPDGKIAGVQ
jgi:ribosomal protein L16 Arg81 hydroxylase